MCRTSTSEETGVSVIIFAGSPLAKKEQQCIVLAIAAVNDVLCLIVLA